MQKMPPDCTQKRVFYTKTHPKAKQTIKKKAKTLWLQLDIISPESKLIVESEGINFIENKCTKIEHEKFLR